MSFNKILGQKEDIQKPTAPIMNSLQNSIGNCMSFSYRLPIEILEKRS